MRTFSGAAAALMLCMQLSGADDVVKTISTGAQVDQARELAPGKFTVFEFYADW